MAQADRVVVYEEVPWTAPIPTKEKRTPIGTVSAAEYQKVLDKRRECKLTPLAAAATAILDAHGITLQELHFWLGHQPATFIPNGQGDTQ